MVFVWLILLSDCFLDINNWFIINSLFLFFSLDFCFFILGVIIWIKLYFGVKIVNKWFDFFKVIVLRFIFVVL